jgi:tRNA/rRNA methyltransferase
VGLLFGPEKTGLTGADLERCHLWITIPTDPACPSINLGQSVALCCYQWAQVLRAVPSRPLDEESAPLSMEQRELLIRRAREAAEAVRFLPFLSAEEKEIKIRRLFLSLGLRRWDAALVHGFLRYVARGRA